MKPVLINRSVARTCFDFAGDCGVTAADITVEVSRVGGGGPKIVYPALSLAEGKLCFAWDDALYNAPSGRYVGVVRDRKGVCKRMCIALHLGCPCTMGASANEYFTGCAGCE